jgi:hypothetical protein
VIVVLLLALTLSRAVAPQGPPLEGYDPARLHAEAVFAERTELFLEAWLQADDDARARARATLEELRRSGAPATTPPSLPALARAWRVASGGGNPAAPTLQQLADALDLRPAPGFFGARTDGLGEPVTVRLQRLWPVQVPGDVLVNLWWLPPQDRPQREALRARSELAAPAAFDGAGFEMYIRPPASAAGTWRLAVELEHGGERVRGVPVPVPCLDRAPEVVGLAREVLDGEGPALELARGLLACARAGVRLPAGLAPADGYTLLRERLAGRPGERPRPLAGPRRDGDGRERWTWAWLPVEPPRTVLILVAPSHEPAQAVFHGARGRLWRDAAVDLQALLLAAWLPRSGAGPEELGAQLARLGALARELAGDVPLAVVARGDALDAVLRGLPTSGLDVAGLIAVTPRAAEPRLDTAGVPTLLLAPEGPLQPTAVGDGLEWARGERELVLDELLLPRLAVTWLPARLAAPATGGQPR